jgi:hypothetical protein
MFTIPNMFEWIHTKGGNENLQNFKKERHVLHSGENFSIFSIIAMIYGF